MDSFKKILVVEDNQDVLEALVSILEYSGYHSWGVTRLSDTDFGQLQDEPPGLIILDVMLSGVDGRDLVRRFKNSRATRRVPILMISA